MLTSHSTNFHIALRTNEGYFVVYIFHIQTWKAFFLRLFFFSLGLLLPDSTILLAQNLSVSQNSESQNYYSGIWRWAQGKVFVAGTPHMKLLHFSVLDKVFWVKRFSLFKTCSDTGIICFYDVMFFSLRFNVLLPENYLFFRQMVIRYFKMQI